MSVHIAKGCDELPQLNTKSIDVLWRSDDSRIWKNTISTGVLMEQEESSELDIASISQLIQAAREGDAAAHNEICRQVQSQLNRMAAKQLDAKLRRKLNPSDIVQATMARMVHAFGDFRGKSSSEFYGWLNSILKNEVYSTRRNFGRQRRDINKEIEPSSVAVVLEDKSAESPEQRLRKREKLAQFQRVIKKLSEDHAKVIELRSIQELSFEEVAKQMDRSVNAVSKLWNRALISLQQELLKIDDSFTS